MYEFYLIVSWDFSQLYSFNFSTKTDKRTLATHNLANKVLTIKNLD